MAKIFYDVCGCLFERINKDSVKVLSTKDCVVHDPKGNVISGWSA